MASNGPEIFLEILFNVAMLPSFCDKIDFPFITVTIVIGKCKILVSILLGSKFNCCKICCRILKNFFWPFLAVFHGCLSKK